MTTDRPLLGIALMLLFCLLAPIGDAVAKLLSGTVPLCELLIVRFGVQALILSPAAVVTQRNWRMSRRVLGLTVLRTLLHMAGIGAMFSALYYLPLADAVAIAFVMPFLMLLLGKYVLNEEVGSRRLWACIVGFIGTLLVIQPSFAEVGWPALLPLIVAVVFSLFMLVTRQIARETDPITLQAISGGIATIIILPVLFHHSVILGNDLVLIRPDLQTGLLLATIGLLGTLAHLVMTWSLRYAPSATLAPMQYLEIPFATLIGWAIFGDLPNGLATVGILITIAAGLFILLRERTISKRKDAGPALQGAAATPAE